MALGSGLSALGASGSRLLPSDVGLGLPTKQSTESRLEGPEPAQSPETRAWSHAKLPSFVQVEASVSPIMVRPVREQLEHDRVIRQLAGKLKRKYEVAANIGAEQSAPVKVGAGTVYPDLVLSAPDRGKKLQGVVEVETGESVTHLEAMAQWAPLGKLRVPFHLYIPAGAIDQTRRLCLDNHVSVAEIWSYLPMGDQIRFAMVYRAPVAAARRVAVPARRSEAAAARKPAAPKTAKAKTRSARPVPSTTRSAKPARAKKAAAKATASRKPVRTQRRK